MQVNHNLLHLSVTHRFDSVANEPHNVLVDRASPELSARTDMISSAYSSPSSTGDGSGVQKCLEGSKTDVECSRRSQIITGVIGSTNAIDIMMRWSAQLLLAAEDHYFEGSMLPKANEGTKTRLGEIVFNPKRTLPPISSLHLRSHWGACYIQSDGPPLPGGAERTTASFEQSHYCH